MIVVKLIGGLGNQLFQYAAGRCLALRTSSSLYFDLSGFIDYPDRSYALERYPVQASIASDNDLACFQKLPKKTGRLHRAVDRVLCQLGVRPGSNGPSYFRQPYFHYTPEFERLGPQTYLDGYWQSERYFSGIAELLRQELALPDFMLAGGEGLASRITQSQSVGIHVRRGDYVSDPVINSAHGVLPLSYYRQGVERIVQGLDNPKFFVFTDDPQWVAQHFDLKRPYELVSDPEQGNAQDELQLMSRCKHFVIANSSFSWWGAWLGNCLDKRVVAPKQWFGPKRMRQRQLKDLYPAGWERV